MLGMVISLVVLAVLVYVSTNAMLPSTTSTTSPGSSQIDSAYTAMATTSALGVANAAMAMSTGLDRPVEEQDISMASSETSPGVGQVSVVSQMGYDPASSHLVKFAVQVTSSQVVDICVNFPSTVSGTPVISAC